MDNLSRIQSFVQVAETRSFVAAARLLGVSASAVGKSIARLEERLNVRLFHRSTRSVTLTAEGAVFLERCRRVLCEMEAAEAELLQASEAPRGKLRLSLPHISMVTSQVLAEFLGRFPEIELELDFTDRLVDVIDEGFDAVIRTGQPDDSRLMSRVLGSFRHVVVGSPGYFARCGKPERPEELGRHALLLYRFPSSGKIERWPVPGWPAADQPKMRTVTASNSIDVLITMACEGLGLACLPDFAIRDRLADGSLCATPGQPEVPSGTFRILWPSSRQLSPKLRAFVDFMAGTAFPQIRFA